MTYARSLQRFSKLLQISPLLPHLFTRQIVCFFASAISVTSVPCAAASFGYYLYLNTRTLNYFTRQITVIPELNNKTHFFIFLTSHASNKDLMRTFGLGSPLSLFAEMKKLIGIILILRIFLFTRARTLQALYYKDVKVLFIQSPPIFFLNSPKWIQVCRNKSCPSVINEPNIWENEVIKANRVVPIQNFYYFPNSESTYIPEWKRRNCPRLKNLRHLRPPRPPVNGK